MEKGSDEKTGGNNNNLCTTDSWFKGENKNKNDIV